MRCIQRVLLLCKQPCINQSHWIKKQKNHRIIWISITQLNLLSTGNYAFASNHFHHNKESRRFCKNVTVVNCIFQHYLFYSFNKISFHITGFQWWPDEAVLQKAKVRDERMNSMSFTWRREVLQLSRNESETGGWYDRRRGDVWRRNRDMDGIELSHSLVGRTPALIPATLGDGCLISTSCQMLDASDDWFETHLAVRYKTSLCNTKWPWPSQYTLTDTLPKHNEEWWSSWFPPNPKTDTGPQMIWFWCRAWLTLCWIKGQS